MSTPLKMCLILIVLSGVAGAESSGADGWISLSNGKNLDGWYSFLLTAGKNNDSRHIFKVEDGMIHILDVDESLTRGDSYGYLATNDEYSDVRIHVEYKWGAKRFPRSDERKRDSGLLYLFHAPDKVFPQSLECQIEESDVGDMWLTDRISVTTWFVDMTSSIYSDDNGAPGVQRLVGGDARVLKSGDFEDRSGWNTVEVVIHLDTATHIVNGRIVNRAFDIEQPDPQNQNQMIPLTKGKTLLEPRGQRSGFAT